MGNGAEEVNAPLDPGPHGVGAIAVEQLPTTGDDQVRAGICEPRQGLDREVEPLEVVGAVEGRDEGGDDRVVGDP